MNARHRSHDAHVRAWRRRQYACHVVAWSRFTADRRYWRAWYRGKISRMAQLDQLRTRGDRVAYGWLRDHWRKEMLSRTATIR